MNHVRIGNWILSISPLRRESQKEIPANFMAPGGRSLEAIGVSAVQIGGADCAQSSCAKSPDFIP